MIRFRCAEDERRFIKLHAEMFQKLARAGLPEAIGSETLRNVGKIELMAHLEGVRQGLALAAIAAEMVKQMDADEPAAIPDPHGQKAFQLHALIYGSADTPLRAIEKEWLQKLGITDEHLATSWLDDKPMRFAPATLQELDGTAPPIAPMISVQADSRPMPVASRSVVSDDLSNECPACGASPGSPCVGGDARHPTTMNFSVHRERHLLPPPEAMHGAEVTPVEPWQKGEYEPDDPVALVDQPDPPPDEEVMPESPDFLDRARDEIKAMQKGGWDPKTWQDLILGLHRHMHVDAGFLDLQLTTHVGRTVLDQCGLIGIAPPDMMSIDFLSSLPGKGEPAPPPPSDDSDDILI